MKPQRSESGFTLVEMLIAIVILGIIVVPITGALVVTLRTTDETSNRMVASNDAQLLSFWLPGDIQSTGNDTLNANVLDDDTVYPPTVSTECSGRTNALRLEWVEQGASGSTYDAAYAVVQAASGSWQLIRYFCVDGGPATSHVVARNLAGASAVSVSESGQTLTMTVTAAATPTEPSGYTFSVSGTRRLR